MSQLNEQSAKELIARVCHDVNKAWCEYHNDMSQPEWDNASDNHKNSLINGVQFRVENMDAPLSANHENWLRMKLHQGYVYGPVKSEAKMTHPSLVPYEQLSQTEQFKDKLFVTVVKSLVAATMAAQAKQHTPH